MSQSVITDPVSSHKKFEQLRVCVIIPTYNNSSTLRQVITDVAAYTTNIIVVNDGSTDNTEVILRDFSYIRVVSYEKNIGKGWALRKGFKEATSLGYHSAISIDSDGQHFASDLPSFIDKLEINKDAVIIGSRNMDQASIPGKSSFGHKFSNFWFKVETGVDCPDTQSGFRMYPLYLLQNMHFFTRKYEFEIEVLVRAAWKGILVDSVPVTVYYAPKGIRVTHFRPFKDFTRVSILNTVLVIIAFLYIKPRDFFRAIFQKKKLRQMVIDNVFNPHESDLLKSASVSFGVFMGIIPIWGFQLVAAIFIAHLLRLNKALVIIAAHISIPPMIPLVIFLSFRVGGYWLKDSAVDFQFSKGITVDSITKNLGQYIYGSFTLAVAAGVFFGGIVFLLLKIFKRKSVMAT